MERLTDLYGVSLFGIWTVLIAAVWAFILYDRRRSRNATADRCGRTTSE